MKHRLTLIIAAALLSVALTPILAGPSSASSPFSFGVIGDTPYGEAQLAKFPQRIAEINADPDVRMVGHLGDIGGPPNCSDSYYATIKTNFDRFVDPLLYSPGDNEWTDCSKASIGPGNPLQRLAAVRQVFFPQPGLSMGKNAVAVTAQPNYPENVLYQRDGITFGLVHIVGSENGLSWWQGNTFVTPEQKAAVDARTKADIALIRSAFSAAKADNSRALALFTQADMFTGSPNRKAYGELVKVIASESLAFGKPVFLFNGDTHTFKSDKPLASSTWLSYYGLTTAVPNLSRIRVQGGSTGAEWLKVTVVGTADVLQVQRVPFGSTAAPTATFTSMMSGRSATFDASASTGPGGVAGYAWDFGDRSLGAGPTAVHEYAAAGTYVVVLTVTDHQGGTASASSSVTVTAGGPGVERVVVPAQSVWRWRFDSVAPPGAWKGRSFDASSWAGGNGVFGFGVTGLGANIDVSGPASSRPLAAYFVKEFTLDSASAVARLSLSTVADDGVVVYVNGTEVGRSNMPSGTITMNSYAKTSVRTPDAVANPVLIDVPRSLLVDGRNVIAVETHLNYRATKNVSFDLTATATIH